MISKLLSGADWLVTPQAVGNTFWQLCTLRWMKLLCYLNLCIKYTMLNWIKCYPITQMSELYELCFCSVCLIASASGRRSRFLSAGELRRHLLQTFSLPCAGQVSPPLSLQSCRHGICFRHCPGSTLLCQTAVCLYVTTDWSISLKVLSNAYIRILMNKFYWLNNINIYLQRQWACLSCHVTAQNRLNLAVLCGGPKAKGEVFDTTDFTSTCQIKCHKHLPWKGVDAHQVCFGWNAQDIMNAWNIF